jgi:hypothetical protein
VKRDYKKWVVKTYVKDIKHKNQLVLVVMLMDKSAVKYRELFIRWDGPWCPCCGYNIVRTSSFGIYIYLPTPAL